MAEKLGGTGGYRHFRPRRRARRRLAGAHAHFCWRARPARAKPPSRLQFLAGGRAAGERCLYITLVRNRGRAAGRRQHRMAGIWRALTSSNSCRPRSLLDDEQQQSLLYSSDLELGETTKRIFEAFERVQTAARRDRQPVGNPAAGAELAALSAPDPQRSSTTFAQRRDRRCCSTT